MKLENESAYLVWPQIIHLLKMFCFKIKQINSMFIISY